MANYQDVPQNIMSATIDANRTRKDHIAEIVIEKNPRVVGIYRLTMKESMFFRSRVIRDLDAFKQEADVVVANRVSEELKDVMDKVYTRDIYSRD